MISAETSCWDIKENSQFSMSTFTCRSTVHYGLHLCFWKEYSWGGGGVRMRWGKGIEVGAVDDKGGGESRHWTNYKRQDRNIFAYFFNCFWIE
jgi:hypothetical protein